MLPFLHPKYLNRIGQLASEIFNIESVDDDNRPLVYYKLTLWAFGSGELINGIQSINKLPKFQKMFNLCHERQSLLSQNVYQKLQWNLGQFDKIVELDIAKPHVRQAKFCLPVVRWFLSGISHFCPTYRLTQLKMSEIILTGHKTQIKKIKKKQNLQNDM